MNLLTKNIQGKVMILVISGAALVVLLLANLRTVSALTLTSSENVAITARVGDITVTPSGGIGIPKTAVSFSGLAYPRATVTILKEGVKVISVVADTTGYFTATLEEKYDSTAVYTLFAVDISGNKSLLINYPIVIYTGYVTHLSGIRFAPTIVIDKAEVKYGDYLTVFGYSLPNASMEIFVEGVDKKNFTLTSNANGTFRIILPMQGLNRGDYVVYARYKGDLRITKLVKFVIGDTNVPNTDIVENIPGDCNYDGVINLVDFSVLAFWYNKNNPPKCVDTNGDKKINLVDFSILAFWWTG